MLLQVVGLSSTIRFVYQTFHGTIMWLFANCSLCLDRGWEQVLQKKEKSTSKIFRNTGKILSGQITKMGNQ